MLSLFTSDISFIFLICIFLVGAAASLLFRRDDVLANIWSSFFSIAGSIYGVYLATFIIFKGLTFSISMGPLIFPLLSISFNIDRLAAFFIFLISIISLFCSIYGIGYAKHYYKKYDIGVLGFFYNCFIAGMLMVVTASNAILFLIAWEIMSIASYFLVIYDRNDKENIDAGFLYLIMTHVGTAFIILLFLLLYKYTGSFDFGSIKSGVALIPALIKNVVFVFAMIGFGTKSGIIPFHIWLPSAHPAAPSHVSGLMSGVMIKTGIYMLVRVLMDIMQPIPLWWGLAVLLVGAISSVLGVLYALTEHDIKRLLAFHSIENIGIILLGLGSSLSFTSLNMPALAMIALVAALFHTLNHAIFKSLLFLSAGSVINETHTRNMEEYGGLVKYMPQTAFYFLVGSMAISALPPFNGFFSEWLTFQSLFGGIHLLSSPIRWIFMVGAGSLALTGGLALACFVKAFGSTFLARPRGHGVLKSKESSPFLLFGMESLALLTLVLGLFSSYFTNVIRGIVVDLGGFSKLNLVSGSIVSDSTSAVAASFLTVSGPTIAISLLAVFIVVFVIVKFIVYREQKVLVGDTWDCGTDLTPRMEITSTGFARSIVTIFDGICARDIYQKYFYQPFSDMVADISNSIKEIQSGGTNIYVLYIFITLVVALFLLP
ncbi:MAG: hydrogenase 4 subunit B [Candidatus Vogelbacteria bacterium]|nr:hydrogenase 4 subunit B [Candidatus Vogelbacteria bacterium]